MEMSLQVVPNPDIDAFAVLKRMNRNHPRCWGNDDALVLVQR